MIETPLRSIITSGIWISIMTPVHSSNIIDRLNLDVCYPIPFVSRYITCLRSDRRYPIPSSISFPASTLYSFRNTISLWSNSSITCLQASRMLCYRVGPENIFPPRGWTNPSLDTCNPTSNFQRHLSNTFMITQLRSDVWCPQSILPVPGSGIISWSKELGYNANESSSNLNYVTGSNCFANLGVSITSFS